MQTVTLNPAFRPIADELAAASLQLSAIENLMNVLARRPVLIPNPDTTTYFIGALNDLMDHAAQAILLYGVAAGMTDAELNSLRGDVYLLCINKSNPAEDDAP